MAKFLTTTGTAHRIEEILKNATSFVTIVTPYLKLSNNIVERLRDAVDRGIKLTIIYGKEEFVNDQIKLVESFPSLKLFYYQNLHAKCYFNESEMIISSMNLHEYSEKNNREMSVYFTKEDDTVLYDDGVKEAKSIMVSSKLKVANMGLEKIEYKQDPALGTNVIYDDKSNQFTASEVSEEYAHLPLLIDRLKRTYVGHTFQLQDDKIYIENFPRKNITLEVDRRVDFRFSDENFYYKIKDKAAEKLHKNKSNNRYYFNYNVINIYLPKNFTIEESKSSKQDLVNRYFEIITNTVEELNKV